MDDCTLDYMVEWNENGMKTEQGKWSITVCKFAFYMVMTDERWNDNGTITEQVCGNLFNKRSKSEQQKFNDNSLII